MTKPLSLINKNKEYSTIKFNIKVIIKGRVFFNEIKNIQELDNCNSKFVMWKSVGENSSKTMHYII